MTALLNRQETAEMFGVSLPTLDAWIRAGMPVEKGGSNGKPYEIDPHKVKVWREGLRAAEEEQEQDRKRRLAELQAELDLEGGTVEGVDALPFDARQKYYASERERMKVAELRGELMRTDRVRGVLERLFVGLSDQLQSLPDYLERRCDMSPADAEKLAEAIGDYQERMAADIRSLFQGTAAQEDETNRDAG